MNYDPELDLLYVGTGNASPLAPWVRSPGGGDNLFLASILAIKPGTGKLAWHFQTTPGEMWDYTATQNMILADLTIDGRPRKVLMQAPKNGYFYVLDRAHRRVHLGQALCVHQLDHGPGCEGPPHHQPGGHLREEAGADLPHRRGRAQLAADGLQSADAAWSTSRRASRAW